MTDLTNHQLVAFAEMLAEYEVPTWPHASCEPCMPTTLNKMRVQYASTYNPIRCEKYKRDMAPNRLCSDSAGILRGFFWTYGGKTVQQYLHGTGALHAQWQAYGFPDTDAAGIKQIFRRLASNRYGTNMRNMPDVPGIIVFRRNTLGIYVGNGNVVTATKFPGCVTKVSIVQHEWESWSYIPFRFVRYVAESDCNTATFCLQLHDGGAKVAEAKHMLRHLGYYVESARDSNMYFGRDMQQAVMALQEDLGHEPTGQIDMQLWCEIGLEYSDSL